MRTDTIGDSGGLLALIPPVRRARLWRLYAQDGRRLLDFWMDGGRDLLGAKGTGLGTAVKAAVDLGIARPLPSVWRQRLARQITELRPAFPVQRFYMNEERALDALAALFGLGIGSREEGRSDILRDPAERGRAVRHDAAGSAAVGAAGSAADRVPGGAVGAVGPVAPALVLRPFAEFLEGEGEVEAASSVCLLRLPCSRFLAPAVLLFRDPSVAKIIGEDLVPPLMLAAASRSLWELKRFASTYREELWRRVDRRLGAFFERRGPFLYPRHRPEEHETVFRAALSAGAVLSPRHGLPSLVPGDFDDGELARLQAALSGRT